MKPSAKRLRRRCNREFFDAFLRIHEVVLISLFLLSYHSLGVSAPVELVGEIVWRFFCLSSEPLPVFFIGNLIILAVTVLSGVGDGNNGRSGGTVDDVYEEYITCQRVITTGGFTPEGSSGRDDEKRIVLYSAPGVSIDRGEGSRPREGKAKKFIDVASSRGRGRLSLPVAVIERDALETPPTIADASPVAGQLSICLRPPVKETEKSADVESPRGSGRLVEVRSGGIKTVEDMSNEEFNQSVEKYIAKTRRFLQEESMLEVEFDTLDRSSGYP